MNPITLVHPTDSALTWTSGKRGQKPKWVQELLEAKPDLLPEKEVVEKVVVEKFTLTNPHTGATWESGTRGMKPKWVQEMIAGKIPTIIEQTEAQHAKSQKPNVWVLTGGYDEDTKVMTSSRVRCFVYAGDEVEALRELNKAFIYPVSKLEFSTMWKPASVDQSIHHDVPGVYQGITDGWTKRDVIKR